MRYWPASREELEKRWRRLVALVKSATWRAIDRSALTRPPPPSLSSFLPSATALAGHAMQNNAATPPQLQVDHRLSLARNATLAGGGGGRSTGLQRLRVDRSGQSCNSRKREREREFTDSSVRRRCRSEVSRRLQRRSLSFSPSPCVQVRAAANHLARLRCRRRQQCVCDSHGSPQVNSPPEPNRTDSPPAASEHKQKRKQKKKEASAVLAKQSATVFGAALSAACDRWESLQAKAS